MRAPLVKKKNYVECERTLIKFAWHRSPCGSYIVAFKDDRGNASTNYCSGNYFKCYVGAPPIDKHKTQIPILMGHSNAQYTWPTRTYYTISFKIPCSIFMNVSFDEANCSPWALQLYSILRHWIHAMSSSFVDADAFSLHLSIQSTIHFHTGHTEFNKYWWVNSISHDLSWFWKIHILFYSFSCFS